MSITLENAVLENVVLNPLGIDQIEPNIAISNEDLMFTDTSPVLQARRALDDAVDTFDFDEDNKVSFSEITAWASGGDAFESEHRNLVVSSNLVGDKFTQTTNSKQPKIVEHGINNKISQYYDHTLQSSMVGTLSPAISGQPLFYSLVYQKTAAQNSGDGILSTTGFIDTHALVYDVNDLLTIIIFDSLGIPLIFPIEDVDNQDSHVISVLFDGVNKVQVRLDGFLKVDEVIANGFLASIPEYFIGRGLVGVNSHFTGWIGPFVEIERAVTIKEIEAVENDLVQRYNIPYRSLEAIQGMIFSLDNKLANTQEPIPYSANCRRLPDNENTDIGFVNGWNDDESMAAFTGAGTLYAVNVYDQTKNGNNMAQSTASKQPQIIYDDTTEYLKFTQVNKIELSVPHDNIFNLDGFKYSIAFKAKLGDFVNQGSTVNGILVKGSVFISGDSYYIGLDAGDRLVWKVSNSGFCDKVQRTEFGNDLHWFFFTYDYTTLEAKIYIDKVLKVSTTLGSDTNSDNTEPLRIGSDNTDLRNTDMDLLRMYIYKEKILTQEDINTLLDNKKND